MGLAHSPAYAFDGPAGIAGLPLDSSTKATVMQAGRDRSRPHALLATQSYMRFDAGQADAAVDLTIARRLAREEPHRGVRSRASRIATRAPEAVPPEARHALPR